MGQDMRDWVNEEHARRERDELHNLRALGLASFNFLQALSTRQPKSTRTVLRLELHRALRAAGYTVP